MCVSAVTGRSGGRTPNPGCSGGGRTNGQERKIGTADAKRLDYGRKLRLTDAHTLRQDVTLLKSISSCLPRDRDTVKHRVLAVKAANDNDSDINKSLFSNSSDKDKKSGSNHDNPAHK